MKKLVLLALITLCMTMTAYAQDDPEYRAEIGAGAGLTAYQGDFNGSLTKNMQPMGAVVGKYRFNPRMSLGLNIGFGKLKASSADADTWYPELQDTIINISNNLVDAGVRFEYNFWPYGTGREYRGAKRVTPYIYMGIGTTFVSGDNESVFTANIPIGIGVKYKIAERLNASLDWSIHFSMSDKLDGVKDPYGIKSSGMFKNTDSYSMLQLSLTYDIMAKCRTCHSDRF